MNLQTVSHKGLSFINVSGSGQSEIHYLKSNFEFSDLHLDDHANGTEIPKIEETKNYTLVVLALPFFKLNSSKTDAEENGKINKNDPLKTLLSIPSAIPIHIPKFSHIVKKERIINTHVDIFIGKDYVVVLHDGVFPQINHIFTLCQRAIRGREEFLSGGPSFLAYKIIDALVDGFFPIVNEISTIIDGIDRQLEKKQSPSTLEDISTTRRNIVVFHTMVNTIIPLFKKLRDGNYKQLNGPMRSFWSNILDHLENILDKLEDDKELIEGISESNEFLLRTKTNEIMKVLTILFTLTIPATVIGTFYGMNILLPGGVGASRPWTFFGDYTTLIMVFIGSILPIFVMLLYFRYRRWF